MLRLVACSACVFVALGYAVAADTSASVTVLSEGKHQVDTAFLGFTTDWWLPWGPFGSKWGDGGILEVDLSNPNLVALAKALTPATWRVGGTPEDTVVYEIGNPPECPVAKQGAYPATKCLSMDRWKEITGFAKETGVELMFGLSGWYGRPDGGKLPMNVTNAAQLLDFTATNGLTVHGFELSNEDNTGGATKYIDADVLGKDFVRIRAAIDAAWSHMAPEDRPILVGPDTVFGGSQTDWINTFLETAGTSINATTYHAYAGSGKDPSLLQKLLTPSYLQGDHGAAAGAIKNAASGHPGLPVIAGEVGPAYGGGRANVTNVFADAFWYLDHLGELSAQGIRRFFRSTFIGGDYELVRHTTYEPNPDYWAALLWARTTGRVSLPTTSSDSNLIAYSMCKPTGGNGASGGAGADSATIVLLNLDPQNTVSVELSHTFPVTSRTEYHVRGAGGDVTASMAELATAGGTWETLKLGPGSTVPDLSGISVTPGEHTVLEPLTYAFVVLEGATCGM